MSTKLHQNTTQLMYQTARRFVYTISLIFIVAAGNTASAAIISNSFDTSEQGWIGIPGEGSLSYFATGGNPDGHIRITDIGIGGPLGSGAIFGPDFTGDLSNFNNGTLSLDMRTFAGGGATFDVFGRVRITGGGFEAFYDLATNAPANWQTYTAPLTAVAWGVSEAVWVSVISQVSEIAMSTDAFNGGDTIGIDNVILMSPDTSQVPVPAAIWVFLTGLLSLRVLRQPLRFTCTE